MSKSRGKSGFSLLELLAVVTILGIIAATIVPRVTSSTELARTKTHLNNVAGMNGAIDRYYFDFGVWPTDADDLIGYFLVDTVPENPIGGPYQIDMVTHRIVW